MRIALIGGVQSSAVALNVLVRHCADVVGVLGYEPKQAHTVSGYVDLVAHARRLRIPNVVGFSSVNAPETVDTLASWNIDVLMVVGLSQLVSAKVRATARHLAVGFHPTRLPKGRGRAPIAWLVLQGGPGAATLFELTDGADEGDILVQVPFAVRERDHASDVMSRCMEALEIAVGEFVAQVRSGQWARSPQDPNAATYWGKRTPEDGRIDWELPADAIDALVRASSEPHPGAYTVTAAGETIIFTRSEGVLRHHTGVPSRILDIRGDGWLIACKTDAVLLTDVRSDREGQQPRVGDSAGLRLSDLDALFRSSEV